MRKNENGKTVTEARRKERKEWWFKEKEKENAVSEHQHQQQQQQSIGRFDWLAFSFFPPSPPSPPQPPSSVAIELSHSVAAAAAAAVSSWPEYLSPSPALFSSILFLCTAALMF